LFIDEIDQCYCVGCSLHVQEVSKVRVVTDSALTY